MVEAQKRRVGVQPSRGRPAESFDNQTAIVVAVGLPMKCLDQIRDMRVPQIFCRHVRSLDSSIVPDVLGAASCCAGTGARAGCEARSEGRVRNVLRPLAANIAT